ncbi:MAG: succinylglutamate-semialdehyde dehydrogenase [Alphaproteobacteria bacterium]|nr:succinylglutamate-semialdehyde dehydrogenase [Alphaproteobacteria bacterium]
MRSELFINGRWVAGAGASFSSTDPAHGGVVWEGAAAAEADVAAAVAAARAAFDPWRRTPLAARVALARAFAATVESRADVLARTISREMGKPLWESRTEVAAIVGKIDISIRMQAERAGVKEEATAFGRAALDHRPWGVMSVFGPFNFPGHLPNGHIVPALLAGNTVVFKPSELTPGVAALMVEAWADAGAPAGVVNLVQGGRETGAALLAQPIDGVLFTGSAHTGLYIHKLFGGRPEVVLALEMGGNNPLIAWDPADPAAAANLVAHSAFATSGQRCSCARRLIVPHGAFGDAVVDAVVALAEGIRVGAWDAEPAPFMGPLAREAAAQRAAHEIDALIAGGARRLTNGPVREGAFLRPTVLALGEGQDAPDEEIFAPVIQVRRARSLDDAIALANATRFGLSGGLICDDADTWARVHTDVRAGVLNWNRPTTGASSAMPFGGPGLSGNGRPSAAYAADYAAFPVASQEAPRAVAAPAQGLPQ